MNSDHVQNLRYKLQRRVRRLSGVDYPVFHYALQQFWGFVVSQPIFVGILQDLEAREPNAKGIAGTILNRNAQIVDSEDENAAICLHVITSCVSSDNQEMEMDIGLNYGHDSTADAGIEKYRTLFVEPLYDYLDEHIDDARSVLALLLRYKHKCEWFQREQLFNLWNNDTGRGEHLLSVALYEYLFDQGIDLSIEPKSPSGRTDFVSSQSLGSALVADVKIFCPEKSKTKAYIISGFNQVYQYTCDFNQTFGYLVIFKTCEQDLKLSFSGLESTIPFVTHNHKTIFFLVIDVCQYDATASKRGKLESVSLSEDELVKSLEG